MYTYSVSISLMTLVCKYISESVTMRVQFIRPLRQLVYRDMHTCGHRYGLEIAIEAYVMNTRKTTTSCATYGCVCASVCITSNSYMGKSGCATIQNVNVIPNIY